jgi:hypothetical protein
VSLTEQQISDIAREAQIAFCLDKYKSFEVAFARKLESALLAAHEGDRVDAERYRWLRDNREAQNADGTICYVHDEDGNLLYNEELDTAIDAARALAPGEKG